MALLVEKVVPCAIGVEALDRRYFDASRDDASALGERPRADLGWRPIGLNVQNESASISIAFVLHVVLFRLVGDGG